MSGHKPFSELVHKDPLIGYEFDVEGGTARVLGPAPGNDQYVTVRVIRTLGADTYRTTRLRSMVEAHHAAHTTGRLL